MDRLIFFGSPLFIKLVQLFLINNQLHQSQHADQAAKMPEKKKAALKSRIEELETRLQLMEARFSGASGNANAGSSTAGSSDDDTVTETDEQGPKPPSEPEFATSQFPRRSFEFSLEQARIIDTFSNSLKDADSKILANFQTYSRQSQNAFILTVIAYGIALLASLVIISVSFYFLFPKTGVGGRETLFSILGFIGGLLGLVATLNRSPIKKTRFLFASQIKLNILFLGYVRQINLIDASFKSIFLTSEFFQSKQLSET